MALVTVWCYLLRTHDWDKEKMQRVTVVEERIDCEVDAPAEHQHPFDRDSHYASPWQ